MKNSENIIAPRKIRNWLLSELEATKVTNKTEKMEKQEKLFLRTH